MQFKSIAEHSAIISTFIKLPVVFKTFVLSIFGWPLKAGFTVVTKKPIFGVSDKVSLKLVCSATESS